MPSPRSRRLWAGVWAMLPLGVLMLAGVLLPPPPGVLTPLRPALTIGVSAVVAAALVTALGALIPPRGSRWMLSLTGAVGAAAAGGYTLTLITLRVSEAPSASGVDGFVPGLLTALVWGGIGYAVHGEQGLSPAELMEAIPELDRALPGAVDDSAVHELPWHCDSSSSSLTGLAAFVLVVVTAAAVLVLVSGAGVLAAVLLGLLGLVAGLLTWAAGEVRLVVDEAGLRVRSRRLPVTVLRVAAVDVLGVQATDLDPMVWGGVGLRWLPGSTAYIGSGGPGIVVHRRSGRRLAVQLTSGEQAAATGAATLRAVAAQALAGTALSS